MEIKVWKWRKNIQTQKYFSSFFRGHKNAVARYTALLYSFKINIITTDCTEARRQRVSVYTHFSRVRLGEEEANVKMCESAAQQMFEISPFALRDRAPRPVVIVVGGLFCFPLSAAHVTTSSPFWWPCQAPIRPLKHCWNLRKDSSKRGESGIVSRRDALISTTLLVLSARREKTFSLRLSASREIIFIVRLASESWQRSLRLEIVISTKTSHKREWILTAFGISYQAINFLNLEAFWWSRLIE